jgi:hypothetical protein
MGAAEVITTLKNTLRRNRATENSEPGGRFVTELGCTVIVVPAPEHLGDGALVVFRMDQPGDGRSTEVYLSKKNIEQLTDALKSAGEGGNR